MKLIIAEKNNVSKQLRNALDPQAKYVSQSTYCGYYIGKDIIFCCANGHLFELASPGEINPDYKRWDLLRLPYLLPTIMPLKPNDADSAYFKTIQTLYDRKDIDEVIVATDPDREGQNIYEKIKRNLAIKKVKETRIWIKEWTAEGLKEAFDSRKPNSEYDGLKVAAEAREEGDAIIGIQGTVAMTKKFSCDGNIYTVGRVQTPTLKFCYDREVAVRNFKPEAYSTLNLKISTDSSDSLLLKHKSKERLSASTATQIVNTIKKVKTVSIKAIKKHTSLGCPKLFTTTEVQKEMNRLHGYSSDKTLQILQSLYQTHSLTTYPRTDKNVISASSAKMASHALQNVAHSGLFDDVIADILSNKDTINKSVISSSDLPHEAITPVFGSINVSIIPSLNKEEYTVYSAILSRFIQAFLPNAEFDETTVTATLTVNNEAQTFEAAGKINTCLGWMKLQGAKKETIMPPVTDGKTYRVLDGCKEDKMTTPPARYSEAALLDAMEHAGRFVSDKNDSDTLKEVEGIGTGATRAAIIKGLKDREYLSLTKGVLIPTEKAFSLFFYLPDCSLSSPVQTARLEQMLAEIIEGSKTKSEFMKEINEQNSEMIDKIKNYSGEIKDDAKSSLGSCPSCGGRIKENAKSFYCENWKAGCKFTVWKTSFHKTITPKILEDVLKGKTGLLTFTYGDDKNKKYKARLYLDEKYQLSREYENELLTSVSKTDYGACPNCGKQIIETSQGYMCSGYKEGCKTMIWFNSLSKLGKPKINKTEAKKLLNGETIVVKLLSKSNKPYEAKAYFEHSENRVKVIFK